MPVLIRGMGFGCNKPIAIALIRHQNEAGSYCVEEVAAEEHRELLVAVRSAIDQWVISSQAISS